MKRPAPQSADPDAPDLDREVRRFTDQLCRHHADEISRDPRTFKKRVLRRVRRGLPPRPGRPPSPQIEAAVALRRQGKTVTEILRLQVTNYDKLDPWTRMLAEKALRQATSRRRKAGRVPNPTHTNGSP